MLIQNLKQISSVFVNVCSEFVKRVMFGLNSLRAESFQSNVFKLLLLALLSVFTCGLVTAVVVRFLDSTATTSQQLSQSIDLQPEKLLGDDQTFKVNLKNLEKGLNYSAQFENKCSDLRQRLRLASQSRGRHYANVYYLSGDRCGTRLMSS